MGVVESLTSILLTWHSSTQVPRARAPSPPGGSQLEAWTARLEGTRPRARAAPSCTRARGTGARGCLEPHSGSRHGPARTLAPARGCLELAAASSRPARGWPRGSLDLGF
ncbi:hypothetical protein Salat_1631600 [Sesamum alatum]|uniref:Uncharacterized protein n=1 Tax=Sesamum alatum TaxID=300844 RepID=A0AAE2CJE6_9LAMI|nr:hypothetical protein Salat_1631600 [Sesamum alatum]